MDLFTNNSDLINTSLYRTSSKNETPKIIPSSTLKQQATRHFFPRDLPRDCFVPLLSSELSYQILPTFLAYSSSLTNLQNHHPPIGPSYPITIPLADS